MKYSIANLTKEDLLILYNALANKYDDKLKNIRENLYIAVNTMRKYEENIAKRKNS